MKPMLAEVLDLADLARLEQLLNDDAWWLQQKLDGDRVLFHVEEGRVTALNRQGEIRRNLVPRAVVREFERMGSGTWTFDGELMDDGTFWLFDMPRADVHIKPSDPYHYRLVVLERFFSGWQPASCVRLLPTARSTEAKLALVERTAAAAGEGVIFKQVDAPYRAGKRSASMLKLKYTKTVDCVVTDVGREGRANCHVSLFDDGQLVEVGSVSTQARPTPHIGDVLEVRYLYASNDRRLYQPVYMRVRADKAATECTIDQLAYTNRDVVEMPEAPRGLVRQRRRAKASGQVVEIHDAWHPQSFLKDKEGRWVCMCTKHGMFHGYRTLKLARTFATQPDLWCVGCSGVS